ncbi:Haloacid dehalogenase-like hydrolase domain-containing protein Sgpp [Hibiscus syriacus]|uniref:Haloacid dehalogenase-like hydrolase domain-containing protein Sgpp n=1 Tax=Hibiscus syriacus TaxID=106335 RepID=A0A6A3B712_HIBSY|nr:Haloacid dehalogenase-like hydrolase domain-containing protein Sgpp [Hibiscus syriacus]
MTAGQKSVQSNESIPDLAPLEAVLFDVDGTLCDSDPIHHHAFRDMLLEIGFNNGVPIDEEFFIKNIAGRHNTDIAATLFPDDLPRGEKFLDDKEAMFRRLASENLPPLKGLYKLTKWIEDRGLKRAAVTNAPRLNAELMISKLGLKDFFNVVIVGSECEHAKPYPDPYLKALELLKVSKDHTFICEVCPPTMFFCIRSYSKCKLELKTCSFFFIVQDSASGIRAGVAAGVPVVGLTTRNPENVLTEANPTLLIKDYEDPKLWAALEELDKKADSLKSAV